MELTKYTNEMKTVIITGYFTTLDGGHLDLIEGAATIGDRLIVIVNNDKQQLIKKGKIILDEQSRVRRMRALRDVDDVILSIDTGLTVVDTIRMIATTSQYSKDSLLLAQGGIRDSDKHTPEADVCKEFGITRVYNVGMKDSSTHTTD